MSEKLEPRKICDLKVTELRSELERRDLDKTGVKAILLERLQKALIEEGEDPENCTFDKFELKNVNHTEKSVVSEKKSPSVEKKKPVTPTKTIKKNVIGRRPGPKSKTCVTHLKVEKISSSISQKENDDVNQEQVDSSNVIASSDDSKTILSDKINSEVIDSNEAEAKEIDIDEPQLNEADVNTISVTQKQTVIAIDSDSTSTHGNTKEFEGEIHVAIIDSKNTKKIIFETESNDIKLTKCLVNLDTDTKVKEKSSITKNDIEEQTYKNNVVGVKEVIPETNEDEDDIQDEELDHEIDEELDHEVNEELDHEINEETNYNNDDSNQTNNIEKSAQEHNKDDNNEDSINLTIGEDDIKLFADEEDTNIEKEDELIENHTKEETLIKQRESRHPVTASSSRATTGLVKSRRSATEKRSSVGDKPRSTHKEDKDISNSKPIISVSMPKDEKKEEEKQVKDKVETGNKQSNDSKVLQISSETCKKNNSSLVRNIWVSGLASITKATDLKQLFSKYGKVVGAKVVTNAKTPGARCYGFVTLSSAEDANRSIENLHKTELHGRVISVERAKRDNGYQVIAKSSNASSKVNENSETELSTKKLEEKKDKREEKREKRPEITINDVKKPDLSTLKRSLSKDQNQEPKRSKIVIERDDRKKERSIKSKSNERDREKLRELERERERLEREKRRQQEILNFTKMKTERERLRQKEQERAMREEERKRRIEKERQLEIERKQKEEAIRLEKERQKLRIERERIEKEKSELLRLERENQRLERERLQREKEELRRAQEKLEETKRQALLKRAIPPSPPLPSKRHSSSNSSRYEERKEPIRNSRIQPNTDYMNQAPPPPNITSSRHRYEQHSSDSRRMRQSPPPPPPPASRPKDSTVNIRYGGAPPATDHHYRSRDDRSDRREESRKKDSSSGGSNRHAHASYDSNKSSYGMSRNSESNTWSSAPVKSSYGTLGSSSGTNNMVMSSRPDPWSNSNNSREIETTVWQRPPQPPPEKWNSTSSNPSSMSISGRSSSSNTLYGNNHQVIPNIGLNMSTNYSDSRFDSYKMSGMSRKY